MIFAHIAGVPVEELLPAVIPTAAGVWNAVRMTVRRRRAARRPSA